ncbi:MAG: hypothetical protein U0703_20505 [Anaerolineae bacterium]
MYRRCPASSAAAESPVPILGDLPVLIIVAAVVLLIGYVILRYTRFGRYVYDGREQNRRRGWRALNTNIMP